MCSPLVGPGHLPAPVICPHECLLICMYSQVCTTPRRGMMTE